MTAINVSFPACYEPSRIECIVSGLIRFCSDFGTKPKFDNHSDLVEVASRLVSKSARALRLVTLRTPKAQRPYEHVPDYILIHVIETLECGHNLTVYPQADPLIAKRRVCNHCQQLLNEAVLPPKKPVKSVRFPAQKKEVA